MATESDNTGAARATDDAAAECKLLSLSAELRHRIYEYALYTDYDSDGDVLLSRHSFSEPGLLHTRRQIRSEASSISYLDNSFSFDIDDLSHAVPKAFYKRGAAVYKDDEVGAKIGWHAAWSWTNLLCWLRDYFDGEIPLKLWLDDDDEAYDTAGRAFDVVKELKKAGKDSGDDREGALDVQEDHAEQDAVGR